MSNVPDPAPKRRAQSRAFGVIHREIMVAPNLSAQAKGLYGLLATYADSAGRCWPSMKTICAALNASERTVQRWFNELLVLGVVVRSPQNRENGSQTTSLCELFDVISIPPDPSRDSGFRFDEDTPPVISDGGSPSSVTPPETTPPETDNSPSPVDVGKDSSSSHLNKGEGEQRADVDAFQPKPLDRKRKIRDDDTLSKSTGEWFLRKFPAFTADDIRMHWQNFVSWNVEHGRETESAERTFLQWMTKREGERRERKKSSQEGVTDDMGRPLNQRPAPRGPAEPGDPDYVSPEELLASALGAETVEEIPHEGQREEES